jgi:hypothetical protein
MQQTDQALVAMLRIGGEGREYGTRGQLRAHQPVRRFLSGHGAARWVKRRSPRPWIWWTTIAMQAIATEAVMAPSVRDGPNMLRCATPGYVRALYEGAGLRDIAEWDVEVELVTRSPEQYWEMISEHVSLAVVALQQVDGPGAGADSGTRRCGRERVRKGRQGPGSGRGAVHRGNETGRERHAPTRRRTILQTRLADPAVARSRAIIVYPAPSRKLRHYGAS